jgi:hypothetical protein
MWKTKWIIEIVGTESISLAIILLYIFMLNWKALQIWWRRWILCRGLWNGQPPAGKREQWNHHWASGQTPQFKLSAMGHQSLLPHSSSAVQHSRPARSKREDQLWQQLIPVGWLPMTPVSSSKCCSGGYQPGGENKFTSQIRFIYFYIFLHNMISVLHTWTLPIWGKTCPIRL